MDGLQLQVFRSAVRWKLTLPMACFLPSFLPSSFRTSERTNERERECDTANERASDHRVASSLVYYGGPSLSLFRRPGNGPVERTGPQYVVCQGLRLLLKVAACMASDLYAE